MIYRAQYSNDMLNEPLSVGRRGGLGNVMKPLEKFRNVRIAPGRFRMRFGAGKVK